MPSSVTAVPSNCFRAAVSTFDVLGMAVRWFGSQLATARRPGRCRSGALLSYHGRAASCSPAGQAYGLPGTSDTASITRSRLKLPGFWRGGNSLKLCSHCAT